ncbi:lantibiotic dehydratase [Dyadobacter beijingensis]|uniref:lantibiotic dehydratase n=1 Tax=Dyadobacter beijingensis TaxID=365489 RepID=UPI00146F7FA3|nr:lantibiotic dehydratase [Dyadobacter beijingensis]
MFQEAIYTASTDLYQELVKWLKLPESQTDNDIKLATSLYKYYTRMCMRSTPYGLFSGCSMGSFHDLEHTSFRVNNENIRKRSRLDMNYLAEIAIFIAQDEEIRPYLIYKPNSSMYRLGENLRLVEYRLKNKKRNYSSCRIKKNYLIDLVVERATGGAFISELAACMDNELDSITATQFINNLIDSQILVSDLEPTLTGQSFFNYLLERLAKIPAAEKYLAFLNDINDTLDNDKRSVSHYVELHHKIIKSFPNTSGKDLVQTDLFFDDTNLKISAKIKETLSAQVLELLKVNFKAKNEDLDTFITNFTARYEGEEIPLAIALDNESGIGYGISSRRISNHMPLLDNLSLPERKKTPSMDWSDRNRFIYQKIQHAKKSKESVILINDSDLQSLVEKDSNPLNFPPSMQAFGTLLTSNGESLDENNFVFDLTVLGGKSSNNILARFGLDSESISDELSSTCRYEENSTHKIIAEIVHLPQSRIGNILMRPHTFKYEIPYLGQSSVAEEFQIPISDLMVSVSGDRVVLRSKKLNQEVLPALTNAHNFAKGLPVYKFLCDLQFQQLTQPFAWASAIDQEEIYIPRIQYKNIILRKSQWTLKKEHFDVSGDIFKAFKKFKDEYNVPRFVLLAQGDNQLLIDTESENALAVLKGYLSKGDIKLVEFLQTPENCILKDNHGNRYCNEIIFSILTRKEKTSAPGIQKNPVIGGKRKYTIGSEWLYVKIYAGTKTADKILTSLIRPLCKELIENETIDKWFFLRYADPEDHIRIRFHSKKANFWPEILMRLNQALQVSIENREVHKFQVDTYNQEIERYGAETMEMSELLFYHDSLAAINFLNLIEGEEGEKYRWLFTLRSIDMLFSDFSLDLKERHDVMLFMSQNYFKEFSGNDKLKHNLNQKYRENRHLIENILNPEKDQPVVKHAATYFQTRSGMNRAVLDNLHLPLAQKERLLYSHIHMTSIRLLIAEPRMQELVIYHYLSKYYESQLARAKSVKHYAAEIV